jgi:sulfate permease
LDYSSLSRVFFDFFSGGVVYPPRKSNFWIYEKFEGHTRKLKIFVIIASLYNAFSIGTNNVANIVGPLIGAQMIEENIGLALIAPLFGMGAFVFHGPLTTAGEKIVPLGILTSTIVCLVTGTLMIIASLLGVPQSFVMIKLASLFAIGGLKNGTRLTLLSPHIKKT